MTTYTAEQIEAIGGRRWTKGDKDRVYLNAEVWAPMIGIETSHYGTGNISGATLNGEKISNSAAYDILSCVSKVYWDAVDGKVHILVYRNRYSDEVPGWIREAIAKAVAALNSQGDDDQGADATATATATDDSQGDKGTGAAEMVAALRNAGRTVRQIAATIGVSVSTIYRWARSICRPRPVNAAALAALA